MIWKCEVVVIDKQNVKILVVGHNKEPTINVITNNLGQMRKIVGSENIEVLKYNDILIVFDENAFRIFLLQVMTVKIMILKIYQKNK